MDVRVIGVSRWTFSLGIVEIIVILAVALIVIPPENLPDVMRATGKILRELRLASNMVVRELSGALDQPSEQSPPPINTMKPSISANGANIALSSDSASAANIKASADAAQSADPAKSVDPAKSGDSATPAVPEATPVEPKATD